MGGSFDTRALTTALPSKLNAPPAHNKPPPCKTTTSADDHEAFELLLAKHAPLATQIVVNSGDLCGEGAFGAVHAASWRSSANRCDPIVVKSISLCGLAQQAVKQVRQELVLHAQAVHPHVVEMVGAYAIGGDEVHLVLRACEGDLGLALAAAAPWLAEAAAWLLASLLEALHYLHDELEVLHSDVKPSNLLLDARAALKLADLGGAALCRGGGRSTLVGSPAYTAPEVVAIDHLCLGPSGARYSFPTDVWSAGVVLHELLCGALPFPADGDAAAQRAAIVFATLPPGLETPPLDAVRDERARRLLRQMLAKQPYVRPSAQDARDSAFVREAAPPSPTDADAWVASVRSMRDAERQGWQPTPHKPTARKHGPPAAESSPSEQSDDQSPGPPSWASSLVDCSPPSLA